ncbi:MAG: hypothetical protein QOG97_402 [Acidimicrobiaceae bacterium]|nr:hypothetical protein [Acidimicrobiaceae bacterium]
MWTGTPTRPEPAPRRLTSRARASLRATVPTAPGVGNGAGGQRRAATWPGASRLTRGQPPDLTPGPAAPLTAC